MSVVALKPVDVVVGLRLAEAPGEKYAQLGADLGISSSSAHQSVRRLAAAGLLRPNTRTVNRLAFREFLEHGVRYAFPARPGVEARGVPTAHAAPPLSSHIVSAHAYVWPSAVGPSSGQSVTPLYPAAIRLPDRCPSVYESLALVDALRVGQARERKLAAAVLARKLEATAA
jgi:hypothetical protein